MFTLRSVVATVALAASMSFVSTAAQATVVTGSSGGSFSSISSCDGICRITSRGKQLQWGSLLTPGSTLTSVARNWSVPTSADDVVLAELVWVNRATFNFLTPDAFGAVFTLGLDFSSPNASTLAEAFSLSIVNTVNNAGDSTHGLGMANLANLTFNLAGITVSDLKYVVAGTGATFDDNVWYTPEGMTSRMYIMADFSDTLAEVPEPASLALLGAGLAGLGALRRRGARGQERKMK